MSPDSSNMNSRGKRDSATLSPADFAKLVRPPPVGSPQGEYYRVLQQRWIERLSRSRQRNPYSGQKLLSAAKYSA